MDFLEANGVGLRYDLAGDGAKTLVLVHEMGGSLDSWDQVLPTRFCHVTEPRIERGQSLSSPQAAATASCHCAIASALKVRSVARETRCR